MHTFAFESYGVFIKITSNSADAIRKAEEVARISLLGDVTPVTDADFDHVFELDVDETGRHYMVQNGESLSHTDNEKSHYKFFDSILRVAIGEHAVGRVFLHAGVVGWRGKAIVMPADSFQGKSTLVSELVKLGAEYYSDEFAILDAEGLVHPFARTINRRTEDFQAYELTVEDLGGKYGKVPIPVGLVLLTGYEKGATWNPEILTPGNGLLKIIPYTLSIRFRTEFSMQVLHNITSRAIIAFGTRGSAETFAKRLLDFVDKHVN